MLIALFMILGLGLLFAGGEAVVRGSTGLARSWGVSPLIIGLTVVAFGTSTPEFAVNLLAVLGGHTDICFGNIVGTNLANIGLIIALTSVLQPVKAKGVVLSRELPMMLLATLSLVALGLDAWLGGEAPDRFDRGDGLILLHFFLIFFYYTVGDLLKLDTPGTRRERARYARFLGLTVAGLVVLLAGGQITVRAAIDAAKSLGMPETVIGLSLVSLGTCLPELTTSMLAAARGRSELAIGNVVGSCIFNLLFVFGTTSMIGTVEVPAGGRIDVLVLGSASVLLLALLRLSRPLAIRAGSSLLLLGYVAYLVWRVGSALR